MSTMARQLFTTGIPAEKGQSSGAEGASAWEGGALWDASVATAAQQRPLDFLLHYTLTDVEGAEANGSVSRLQGGC